MILCVCPNPSIDTYSWIDDIILGKVNRIRKQEDFPGGKGIHVAMALNELGEQSTILGNWAGATGNWIEEQCMNYSIPCYGPKIKGSNRKCFTFRSELNDVALSNTELLEPGPELKPDDYKSFIEEFEIISDKAELICLSGSWPVGVVPSASQELTIRAKRRNRRVILDASGLQLLNAIKSNPYAIHLNLEEARSLYQTDNIAVILEQLSLNVELIALTVGEEGLYLKYQDNVIQASVGINKVISSIGSGDCLTAGMAYGLHHNMSLKDIARWGVACGTANCLREELGMLYKKDVHDLLNLIHIKELSL